MACAALLIACKPEPHKRLTVCPPTSWGRSASNKAMRATLRLSSPAWFAQPRITSSILRSSMFARRTASAITSAAISSGRTSASLPAYRPMGVRTAERITASCMVLFSFEFCLALLDERLHTLAHILGGEQQVEILALDLQPFFQRGLVGCFDRFLRQAYRYRRLGRYRFRQ